MALRLRRGTDAERQLVTPLQGELVYATDTKKLYVGDGATQGGVLVGPADADQFTELVADTSPQLGGDLDLNNNSITGTGNINIDGTITATGNIGLGDDTTDIINVSGVINSDLRPAIDGRYNLGSEIRRWNNLFAEGISISGQIDASAVSTGKIVSTGSSIVYDETSDTLSATNVTAQSFVGDLNGSVFGDDSTPIVDGINAALTATTITGTGITTLAIANIQQADINSGTMDGVVIGGDGVTPVANISGDQITSFGGFIGNLTGDVVGNIQGDVIGSIKGSVFGGDSSIIIDDTTSTVLGNVNNNSVQTDTLTVDVEASVEYLRIPGPLGGLSITTTGNQNDDYSLFEINNFQSTADSAAISFFRARGTEASPTVVTAGDGIMLMGFNAMGTNSTPGVSTFILAGTDPNGTIGDGIVPGEMTIGVQNDAGTTVEAIKFDKDGKITVAGNTLVAGAGSGEIDDSAAVSYLEINVGGTSYGIPLYAIRP
jgi:hypothetical protein